MRQSRDPARWAIVADDLSGALDAGVQFVARGFRGSAVFDRRGGPPGDSDVMALTTNSRDASPAIARRQVRQAIQWLRRHCADRVFKKIDSTGQGNLVDEGDAALESLDLRTAVICPANPSQQRVAVIGGGFGFGSQTAKAILSDLAAQPIRQAIVPVTDGIPPEVAQLPYALLTSLVSNHLDLRRWFGGEIETRNRDGPLGPARAFRETSARRHAADRVGRRNRGQHQCHLATGATADGGVDAIGDRRASDDDRGRPAAGHRVARITRPRAAVLPQLFRSRQSVLRHRRRALQAFLRAMATGQEPPVTGVDGCATRKRASSKRASSKRGSGRFSVRSAGSTTERGSA